MGRVLLIIGGVVGVLIFAFGVLALIGTATTPNPDPAGYYGSFLFMGVGAAVAAPCIFFARRMASRSTPPWSPVGSSTGVPVPGNDLRQSYLAWFAWSQQALGGDAVSMHAATMAAMTAGAGGNPAAAAAEAARQTSRIAAPGATPAAPSAAKVRSLAQMGASTIGLLEPSERVLVSFKGTNRPAVGWGLAFGAMGSLIAATQVSELFVTVTDRRVIAVSVGLGGGLANKIALIEPRATVTAKFPKGIFGRLYFSLKGQGGAAVRIVVPRQWRPEAVMALELLTPSVGQVGSVGVIR